MNEVRYERTETIQTNVNPLKGIIFYSPLLDEVVEMRALSGPTA